MIRVIQFRRPQCGLLAMPKAPEAQRVRQRKQQGFRLDKNSSANPVLSESDTRQFSSHLRHSTPVETSLRRPRFSSWCGDESSRLAGRGIDIGGRPGCVKDFPMRDLYLTSASWQLSAATLASEITTLGDTLISTVVLDPCIAQWEVSSSLKTGPRQR